MINQELQERLAAEAIVQKPMEFTLNFTNEKVLAKKKLKKRFLKGWFPWFSIVVEEEFIQFKDSLDFKVFPPTLGKLEILSSLFLQMEIDFKNLTEDPSSEIFRVCKKHTDILAKVMAVSVLNRKEELLDSKTLEKQADFFKWHCNTEDFSIILGGLLAQVDLSNFSNSIRLMKLFRLNKPRKNQGKANRVEKSEATQFGVQ